MIGFLKKRPGSFTTIQMFLFVVIATIIMDATGGLFGLRGKAMTWLSRFTGKGD